MTQIASVGLGIPKHRFPQEYVKQLITKIFPLNKEKMAKYLPVFDNAAVNERQLAIDSKWIQQQHTFQEKNDLYQECAMNYSLKAMDQALTNTDYITKDIPYNAIDIIIFVSSTGIATPSICAHLMNERSFREDAVRMPLWGLGCAGGAIGLARGYDWLKAYPKKTALIVCCELASLTFQKDDVRISNLVGTAIFGDGVGAVLMTGRESPYRHYCKNISPKILSTSSRTKKNSTSIMGWDVTNRGLEVVFSKEIPNMVDPFWKEHLEAVCKDNKLDVEQIHSFIAHPGGKKVLSSMERALKMNSHKLKHAYSVLKNHGNMSSATVIYVLNEWMKECNPVNEKSILCALGPGFSSEIIILEW
ncbi:MAG TPA: 3-oxoacyl-[acyl-carrier-protein] synthase III C-terminal domain-containing protein [Bacillota bacterium]|nr:3-oxoacyl-[acyl-carrier-protein] synthase III C-terminal domain-containing protein [Bacillota bacterium]